jgi:hypothetical protein
VTSDQWPPLAIAPYVSDWSQWAAWWAADTARLDGHHTAGNTTVGQPSKRNGGRFWSRQQTAPANPARNLLHVPLAADVAQTSADLLFGDAPKLRFDKGQEAAQDRLDGLLHEAALLNDLHFAAETCAAIGGVYLRPMWDVTVADRPLLTVVGADQAIPEIRYGVLVAVTFWEQLPSPEGVVFRHLERHEPGIIRHTLHAGTETTLGPAVPYTEHPDMAWLLGVDLVDGNGINTAPITKRLLVDYIPNAPSRTHRKAGIGRADIDGSEPLLDALDETWTSWMRDLRLGRARIVVNEQALTTPTIGGATLGARGFDVDKEVFAPIPGQANMGEGDFIKPVQFAIRVQEHADTAMALVERIVTSCGYSPESFGIHAEGALSGTAYKLRERRTFRTESRKQRLWGPAVEHTSEMLLAIGREVFGWEPEARPSITWPETDTDEPLQRAQTISLLRTAQAISAETAIRLAQPDLDDDQVREELARVMGDEPVDDGDATDDTLPN